MSLKLWSWWYHSLDTSSENLGTYGVVRKKPQFWRYSVLSIIPFTTHEDRAMVGADSVILDCSKCVYNYGVLVHMYCRTIFYGKRKSHQVYLSNTTFQATSSLGVRCYSCQHAALLWTPLDPQKPQHPASLDLAPRRDFNQNHPPI
jgi:hypothetical protein